MITRRVPAGARGKAPAKPRVAVVVDEEERRRLIEGCAFFRAERFRPVNPGSIRKQDLEDAAAAIDTAICTCGMHRKKARR
jgi:hypothetical protein